MSKGQCMIQTHDDEGLHPSSSQWKLWKYSNPGNISKRELLMNFCLNKGYGKKKKESRISLRLFEVAISVTGKFSVEHVKFKVSIQYPGGDAAGSWYRSQELSRSRLSSRWHMECI